MGMRPSANLCYSIEVSKEALETLLAAALEEDFDYLSEALEHYYKLSIAFAYSDWYDDEDTLIVYGKSYNSYGYGDVTTIENFEVDAESVQNLLKLQKDLGVPNQLPKWRIYAEFN